MNKILITLTIFVFLALASSVSAKPCEKIYCYIESYDGYRLTVKEVCSEYGAAAARLQCPCKNDFETPSECKILRTLLREKEIQRESSGLTIFGLIKEAIFWIFIYKVGSFLIGLVVILLIFLSVSIAAFLSSRR